MLPNLEILNFRLNFLEGSLMLNHSLANLKLLDVSLNRLAGTLAAAALPSLEYLFLFKNKFTGSISKEFLSSVSSLQILQLNLNSIQGTIP